MTELKHWLDEASDANELERAVLRSGFLEDPPRIVEREVWAKTLCAISAAPLAAATSGHAAAVKAAAGGVKAGAVWLGVGQGFIVGLALYGAVSVVNAISERWLKVQSSSAAAVSLTTTPRKQQPAPPLRTAPLDPAPEPSAARTTRTAEPALRAASASASSNAELAPTAAAPEAPSVASFEDPPSSAGRADDLRKSQLKAEASALREARAQLRAGQLSNAFATLEASRRQFVAPELYQEREALMIELLYRGDQRGTAALRAKAFLERFPESPHAEQVRQFTAPH